MKAWLLPLVALTLASCGSREVGAALGYDVNAPKVSFVGTPTTITSAGPLTVRATASDDRGIQSVVLSHNGGAERLIPNPGPYEWTIRVNSFYNGQWKLRLMARDSVLTNTAEAVVSVSIPMASAPTLRTTHFIRNEQGQRQYVACESGASDLTRVEAAFSVDSAKMHLNLQQVDRDGQSTDLGSGYFDDRPELLTEPINYRFLLGGGRPADLAEVFEEREVGVRPADLRTTFRVEVRTKGQTLEGVEQTQVVRSPEVPVYSTCALAQ